MSTLAVLLLPLALILLSLPTVSAHGMMCGPRQRAAYVSPDKCGFNVEIDEDPVVIDFCAHCLNGGTVATVKANLPPGGWKEYDPIGDYQGSANRAGICGDPKGRVDHMIGGDFMPYDSVPIVANWKTNSVVDFTAEIDTNHNGYFEFFICNMDKCNKPDIDGSCFEQGHCVRLDRVPHPDCEDTSVNTDFECGPIDPIYPGRWYLPCRNTGHVGVHIVGGESGTMRYQLPRGFRCKWCVVQWYWATANSCAPRGFLNYFERFNQPFGTTCPSDGGGFGAHRPGMASCGGDKVPEEFWSCADVQITNNGRSAGPVRAVGQPTPSPGAMSEDGVEVQEDPEGVIDRVTEEIEEDIELEASENSGDRKREEEQAAKGDCLLEDSVCDATVPCCDVEMVCVYTEAAGNFTCRFWWSLWKDVEQRRQK
eukprot:GFKZ01003703.1.p2 GENE.GFKZ01003703.1~~GFKZ01003703.1.p2  ORF type:complete len:424 (-),score=45.39 GFKZ01003703.1:277-1548(-)